MILHSKRSCQPRTTELKSSTKNSTFFTGKIGFFKEIRIGLGSCFGISFLRGDAEVESFGLQTGARSTLSQTSPSPPSCSPPAASSSRPARSSSPSSSSSPAPPTPLSSSDPWTSLLATLCSPLLGPWRVSFSSPSFLFSSFPFSLFSPFCPSFSLPS